MTLEPEDPPLPGELRAFLFSCFDSIEQVELLMILRGSDRWRSTRDVSEELRVALPAARRALETLAARGLLEVTVAAETTYRYKPRSADLSRYADLLAQHYVSSRHTIYKLVTNNSRTGVKRFADAFKLREPE